MEETPLQGFDSCFERGRGQECVVGVILVVTAFPIVHFVKSKCIIKLSGRLQIVHDGQQATSGASLAGDPKINIF